MLVVQLILFNYSIPQGSVHQSAYYRSRSLLDNTAIYVIKWGRIVSSYTWSGITMSDRLNASIVERECGICFLICTVFEDASYGYLEGELPTVISRD